MINYRKATIDDINPITKLISELLGTSYYNKNLNKTATFEEIFENNEQIIEKQIDNFYVACDKNTIVGACGFNDSVKALPYAINLKPPFRRLTYIAVDKNYQNKGIGLNLTKMCLNTTLPILCEAWGDNGKHVNMKFILEKLGFNMVNDLGEYYIEKNNCPYCVNRNKNCSSCMCQIWVKYN